jgi:hypothetical protein
MTARGGKRLSALFNQHLRSSGKVSSTCEMAVTENENAAAGRPVSASCSEQEQEKIFESKPHESLLPTI